MDLTVTAVSVVQRRIRSRVLRIAVSHGTLTAEVAADLAGWVHGGEFSLHAGVRIEVAAPGSRDQRPPDHLTQAPGRLNPRAQDQQRRQAQQARRDRARRLTTRFQ